MYYDADRQSFIQKIISYPNLSRDEEYALIAKWQEDGDEAARNKIVEAYLKSILPYVKKLPPHLFFDAVNAATMGLMQAIDKFDASKGFRVATLSQWYIRSALQLEPSLRKPIVKVPESATRKKLRGNLIDALRKVAGDKLDYNERDLRAAAKDLAVPFKAVRNYYIRASGDTSLNSVVNGDSKNPTELIDLMADEGVKDQETLLIEASERSFLRRAFEEAKLKDREAYILQARRLQDGKVTLQDLSKIYGVSRERIRQIEVAAFKKVQRAAKKLRRSFKKVAQNSSAVSVVEEKVKTPACYKKKKKVKTVSKKTSTVQFHKQGEDMIDHPALRIQVEEVFRNKTPSLIKRQSDILSFMYEEAARRDINLDLLVLNEGHAIALQVLFPSLSENQAKVLELGFLELDLKRYAAIASELGLTEGTIQQQASGAFKKIKKESGLRSIEEAPQEFVKLPVQAMG